MKEYVLTTVDNPFDPFRQFDEWFSYDLQLGYNTCSLLALFSHTSNDWNEEDNEEELNRAMDEIVNLFNGKIFIKVSKEDFKNESRSTIESK